VATALPHAVTQVDPPASLRSRILQAAGAPVAAPARDTITPFTPRPAARPASIWSPAWLSAAALLLVSVGLGAYALTLRNTVGDLRAEVASLEDSLTGALARLERSEQQVAVATRAVSTAEARLAVLTASDMLRVDLQGQPVAPRASGRAFWSRSRGLVFTAANLPPLPAGRGYQLWVVTAQAPVSAGMLQLDNVGSTTQAFETPVDIPPPVAVAVTVEPEGGAPAPTGDKYLVGLTH
jgi:hypothetical protein